MNNIISKLHTLRKAVATATVTVSSQHTIDAVLNGNVPKGNVFEFSRAAGLLGIKRTSDMIPDCHPLPVEYAAISYRTEGLSIIITAEVHTIYKTGVEVEAMHGASVTALTIYDMLKPIDKGVEISAIRLLAKSGGKSDLKKAAAPIKCAVIVCSDSISRGEGEDQSGKTIISGLEQWGIATDVYRVIPDEKTVIQETVAVLKDEGFRLAIFTGGTGASPRDVTPDAIEPLLNRKMPGIMEFARQYGQARTPYAMLSRGIAGFSDRLLILTLPGSVKGAEETMAALFPQLVHIFQVADGERHGTSGV